MSPDEYQQAWQAHASRTRVTIDADVLAKHVQRSQRDFLAMVLLRDCREAGISILMIPVWFYLGYLFSPVWTWYLIRAGASLGWWVHYCGSDTSQAEAA